MAMYVPNDRVWVLMDGYDWWPARVLSSAEVAEMVGARRPGCDIAVSFYPGTITEASIHELHSHTDHDHICYFESSSEKAVTNNEDLKAAIQLAMGDTAANPLKTAKTSAAVALANGGESAGRAVDMRTAKRARLEAAPGADASALAHGKASAWSHHSTAVLQRLARDIHAAAEAGDVDALRDLLDDLDHVDVPLVDLEETRIGVAVGRVLGNAACAALWPLARAIVSFWARHLPAETLEAIRRVKEHPRRTQDAIEALVPAFSSPTTRPGGTSGFPTGTPGTQRSSFFSTLCELLDDPSSSVRISSEQVEKVARDLVAEVQSRDERLILTMRLRHPGLSYIKGNLLSGKWTAKQYLEQPEDAFKTEGERAAEERRLHDRIEAEERAKLAMVNVTSLFTCPSCHKNRCHFYEQQTRSADEPTTKFITCLDCKTTWTQE